VKKFVSMRNHVISSVHFAFDCSMEGKSLILQNYTSFNRCFLDLKFSIFSFHYTTLYAMDFVVHISHHNFLQQTIWGRNFHHYNLLAKLFSQRTPSRIMNVKFPLLVYTFFLQYELREFVSVTIKMHALLAISLLHSYYMYMFNCCFGEDLM